MKLLFAGGWITFTAGMVVLVYFWDSSQGGLHDCYTDCIRKEEETTAWALSAALPRKHLCRALLFPVISDSRHLAVVPMQKVWILVVTPAR